MVLRILTKFFGRNLVVFIAPFLPWIAIAALFGLGYWYVESIRQENISLRHDVTTLTTTVDTQHRTIDTMSDAIDEWEAAQVRMANTYRELAEESREALAETRRLNDVFANHDFSNLLSERPGLMEQRINRGTDDIIRMLECASGNKDTDC